MTAKKAELMLLKIGDGAGAAETFTTLGGLRSTRMTIQRQPVAAMDVTAEGWRRLVERAGNAQLRIQGSGLFTDSAAEAVLRMQAMHGSAAHYRLYFGDGGHMAGAFVVSSYERSGKVGGMEAFGVTLESAGAVSYVPA